MPDSFSERVKALREKKKLSLRGLARAASIPVSTVSYLEGGQRLCDDLSVRTAKRLALAFGVTLDYLCGTQED